ncbi:MmpS family transport accessory protein [Actinoplanes sp. CA-252034]|uniref:MmpS family transport accessory protein n=1 Tax=Actinoplanes sp. CA-252034 TaxID=3239906 RepID=UPI003D9A016F
MSDPSEPRQPPRPPHFTPPPDYPPTAQFPPVGPDPNAGYAQPPPYDPTTGYAPPSPPPYDPATGYPPQPGYGQQPGYGPAPLPPRRSKTPLIALILAITLLLCGGVVTASVMLVDRTVDKVNEVADDAKKAAEPITDPTFPDLLPSGAPGFPGFPDLPALPTNIPGIGEGKEISVTYEVTGDGPAEILYMEKLDGAPARAGNAELPWKFTTTMKGPSVVSVIAMRTGIDSGSISCRASVDGKEVAANTAEGTLATANCYDLVLY